jgi:hypothetical protein
MRYATTEVEDYITTTHFPICDEVWCIMHLRGKYLLIRGSTANKQTNKQKTNSVTIIPKRTLPLGDRH